MYARRVFFPLLALAPSPPPPLFSFARKPPRPPSVTHTPPLYRWCTYSRENDGENPYRGSDYIIYIDTCIYDQSRVGMDSGEAEAQRIRPGRDGCRLPRARCWAGRGRRGNRGKAPFMHLFPLLWGMLKQVNVKDPIGRCLGRPLHFQPTCYPRGFDTCSDLCGTGGEVVIGFFFFSLFFSAFGRVWSPRPTSA